MLPPLPPCSPPVVTIWLPVLSLNTLSDFKVTLPPELPPAVPSPRAKICESAPRLSESDATSSMTPFLFITELACTKPSWLMTLAFKAIVPASAMRLPKLSTEPCGSFTCMLIPRPSGRSLNSTVCPAASPIVPSGATTVP